MQKEGEIRPGEDLGDDEPLVQGPQELSGAQVPQRIGLLLGDQGERLVEAGQRSPAGPDPVPLPPKAPQFLEEPHERLHLRVGQVPDRHGTTQAGQEGFQGHLPLRPEGGDDLLG